MYLLENRSVLKAENLFVVVTVVLTTLQ